MFILTSVRLGDVTVEAVTEHWATATSLMQQLIGDCVKEYADDHPVVHDLEEDKVKVECRDQGEVAVFEIHCRTVE